MPIDPTIAEERVTFETAAEYASTRVPVFAPDRHAGAGVVTAGCFHACSDAGFTPPP